MLFFSVCMLMICAGITGHAEKQGGMLRFESAGEGRVWTLTLYDIPPGEVSGMAVMFDISLGKESIVPKMVLPEAETGLTLTIGRPADDRVRVLIDGERSNVSVDGMIILHVQMPGDATYEPHIENACLWFMDKDGRVVISPLSVEVIGSTESESPPDDKSAESFSCDSTALPTGSETVAETPSEVPEETRIPNQTPETETNDTPSDSPALLYLGCCEKTLQNQMVSIKLYFWKDPGAPAPAVLCRGGGQGITLTEEKLGDTSILACTLSGIRATGWVHLTVDIYEETIEIRYFDGRFIDHRPQTTDHRPQKCTQPPPSHKRAGVVCVGTPLNRRICDCRWS